MDIGSAAIACTAIVMAGIAALTYFRKEKPMENSSFKNIHKILSEKLKDVVFKDTCNTQVKSFEHEFELTRQAIKDGFKDLKETIKDAR